ncbi:MAG TPA: antitoxin [Caulobacteraceae bacterium]|jgi:predicted transcriptional regulator
MLKREPSIFNQPDSEADEAAMREGEADGDAGRFIPHSKVAAWLRSWGTPGEKPAPRSWFK